MRGSKTINFLAENTNSYLACATTGPLSSYSRYAGPMICFHPSPTRSSSSNRAHAALLYVGKVTFLFYIVLFILFDPVDFYH